MKLLLTQQLEVRRFRGALLRRPYRVGHVVRLTDVEHALPLSIVTWLAHHDWPPDVHVWVDPARRLDRRVPDT